MRIKGFGGFWRPQDANNRRPVERGVLIAWDFKPWRLVDYRLDTEQRDGDNELYDYWIIILRPDGLDMDQTAHSRDVHLRGRVSKAMRVGDPITGNFDRLHEHYGLCVHCGELLPCRDRMAEQQALLQTERMARYETPGVCPECLEPVTDRQDRETFPNIYVPLGPDVTFHAGRKKCRQAMEEYRGKAGQPDSRLKLDGGRSLTK